MSQYVFDNNSNTIAGIKVTSKNQGAVGAAGVKSGTGNSSLNSALLALQDIDDLDVYLAASTLHGSGYYTAAKLSQMTKNDKVYAARLIADPTSVR